MYNFHTNGYLPEVKGPHCILVKIWLFYLHAQSDFYLPVQGHFNPSFPVFTNLGSLWSSYFQTLDYLGASVYVVSSVAVHFIISLLKMLS